MRSKPASSSLVVRPIDGLNIDLIRSLRDRSFRDQTGLFLAEGARFLCATRDHGFPLAGIVLCRSRVNGVLLDIVRQARDPPILELPAHRFDELTMSGDPSHGVLMVLRHSWSRLPDRVNRKDLWVAVETIRNPGNLGTLLRSCAAVGGRGLMVFGPPRDRADPFDPLTVRASMGAMLGLDVIATNHQEFRRWNRRYGVTVLAATGEATRDYRSVSYRRPVVLMLGHERSGLSEAQRITCDHEVRIPMPGPTDSLNVAMAGTVLMYEAYGQRNPVESPRRRR